MKSVKVSLCIVLFDLCLEIEKLQQKKSRQITFNIKSQQQ